MDKVLWAKVERIIEQCDRAFIRMDDARRRFELSKNEGYARATRMARWMKYVDACTEYEAVSRTLPDLDWDNVPFDTTGNDGGE